MTEQDRILTGSQDGQNAAATTLHLIFRFLRTVRLRKGIIISSCGFVSVRITERKHHQRFSALLERYELERCRSVPVQLPVGSDDGCKR